MCGFVKELVIKILTPYLGKSMTEASIELFCKEIGISPHHLTAAHIPDLTKKIGPGIVIFIGQDKADQVLDNLLKIH